MIIENENNKITVRLSKKDLEVYDIDFFNINFKSKKAKELLEEWLFIAGVNFDIYDNNFMVNTSSVKDEYIIEIILFYKQKLKRYRIKSKRRKIKTNNPEHIFLIEREKDMEKLIEQIDNIYPKLKYKIYLMGDKQYIIICLNYIFLNLKKLLSEYAVSLGHNKITCALIKEYGKVQN